MGQHSAMGRNRIRSSRLVGALLAGSLLLAACGDDDDLDADDLIEEQREAERDRAERPDREVDLDDLDDLDDRDDDLDLDDLADGGPIDLDAVAVADFCGLMALGDEAFDDDDALSDRVPVEQRRRHVEALITVFDRLAEEAPEPVKADVDAVVSGFQVIFDALADHGYSLEAVFAAAAEDPTAQEAIDTATDPVLEQASDRIDDWADLNCPGRD